MGQEEDRVREMEEKMKAEMESKMHEMECRLEEERKKTEKEKNRRRELEKEKDQLEKLVETLQEKYDKQENEHRERFQKLESRMSEVMNKLEGNEEGAVVDSVVYNEKGKDLDEKVVMAEKKLIHSTPKPAKKKKKNKEVKVLPTEHEESSLSEESDIGRKEKRKKKKNKSKRSSQSRKIHIYASADDSLYSSTKARSSLEESTVSSDDSEDDLMIQKGLLIREIPKATKFNVYSRQDIHEFFREYERYCKSKYADHPEHWVKELGEFLEGRMNEFYRTIICAGPVKFGVVKERMIEQVKRIRGSVRYKRRDDFERVRMNQGENLDIYAYRLETLARQKFGDGGIENSKVLVRKFLETIPEQVSEYFNLKRKEKVRHGGDRLRWSEILELLEDRPFDEDGRYYPKSNIRKDKEREREREVKMGHAGWATHLDGESGPRSYRDALRTDPLEVMAKFMEDFYDRQNQNRNEWPQINMANGNRDARVSSEQTYQDRRNQTQGRNRGNQEMSQSRNAQGGRAGQSLHCNYCGNNGHDIENCRQKTGACFLCGQHGHFARECRSQGAECKRCNQYGHIARYCRAPGTECRRCGQFGHNARFCKVPYENINNQQYGGTEQSSGPGNNGQNEIGTGEPDGTNGVASNTGAGGGSGN